MDDEKIMELTSLLEEMKTVMEELVSISQKLAETMEQSGTITMELKQEHDDIVNRSKELCAKVEAAMSLEEKPM